jgi:RND family efflux transporter MFP subunit
MRRLLAAALGAATMFTLFAAASRAHEGHDHNAAKPAMLNPDQAHRLPDGSVFVPEPTQRIFDIRTAVTESGAHRLTTELPGRVIPDPNASGLVQSAVGGRLSPPPGGFPRLGTAVKTGDVLAYVTPPVQTIDVSDMRQRQGELDQQIAITERRLARQESLVPSGAVARSQLEDTRSELQGLKDRRASLDSVRREPEALVAPVSGVIADGSAVAGQIVAPSAIVFHIIDPGKLWVEALSFETVPAADQASAKTASGKSYALSFRGSGYTDRSQSIPVHFAIEGDLAGLRAGQFVTVTVSTAGDRSGIAIPRASLVRSSNGQDIVYEHNAAESFVPRPVRIEPLDGERVLAASGLQPGMRVVTQGADLLDHVR